MRTAKLSLTVVLSIAVMGVLGCESNSGGPTPSSSNNAGYAGGNGAFGESPKTPGSHSHDATSDSTNTNTNDASGSH